MTALPNSSWRRLALAGASLVLLSACAQSPIRVESMGAAPPRGHYCLSPSSDAGLAAARTLRQRGLIAESAERNQLQWQMAMLTRPAAVGVCKTTDIAAPAGCGAWLTPPDWRRRPFSGPATEYRLSLRLVDPANGQIIYAAAASAQRRGKPAVGLPDQLLTALLNCDHCAAGPPAPR